MSVMQVSWGPQHPASGQFRIILWIDGDLVVKARPDIGYTHRCIEKLVEGQNYLSIVPTLERISNIDSMNMALGYCRAVEELMGVDVPERGKILRTLVAEINRILSHLYWIGLYHVGAGLFTSLMWPIADRELLVDLLEMVTGSRVTYFYIIPGGVWADVPEDFYRKALVTIDYFERRIADYEGIFRYSPLYTARGKDVGVLKQREAIELGATGPTLRGSGMKADVRKDEPYAGYDEFEFDVPTGEAGDAATRAGLWFDELRESCRIIRQAVERLRELPRGRVRVRVPFKPPKGEVYSRVESSRGELGYYLVSDGTARPYRLKISTPSFRSAHVLEHLLEGAKVADVPVITFSTYLFPLDADR